MSIKLVLAMHLRPCREECVVFMGQPDFQAPGTTLQNFCFITQRPYPPLSALTAFQTLHMRNKLLNTDGPFETLSTPPLPVRLTSNLRTCQDWVFWNWNFWVLFHHRYWVLRTKGMRETWEKRENCTSRLCTIMTACGTRVVTDLPNLYECWTDEPGRRQINNQE